MTLIANDDGYRRVGEHFQRSNPTIGKLVLIF